MTNAGRTAREVQNALRVRFESRQRRHVGDGPAQRLARVHDALGHRAAARDFRVQNRAHRDGRLHVVEQRHVGSPGRVRGLGAGDPLAAHRKDQGAAGIRRRQLIGERQAVFGGFNNLFLVRGLDVDLVTRRVQHRLPIEDHPQLRFGLGDVFRPQVARRGIPKQRRVGLEAQNR